MKSKMSKARSASPSWTQLAPARKKVRTDLSVPLEYLDQVRAHSGHRTDITWDRMDGRKELRTLACRSCAVTITIPRDEN